MIHKAQFDVSILTTQLMLPSLATTHSALMSQGLGWPLGQSLVPWQPPTWSPVKPLLHPPQRKEPWWGHYRVRNQTRAFCYKSEPYTSPSCLTMVLWQCELAVQPPFSGGCKHSSISSHTWWNKEKWIHILSTGTGKHNRIDVDCTCLCDLA